MIPYGLMGSLILLYGMKRPKIRKEYNDKHTVTVFLPTYNEEKYIEKKLQNLLTQSYPIKEILIFDCSTDRTPQIIENYQKNFACIKLYRQTERVGMARTINEAFKAATGSIFIKTDCDSFTPSQDSLRELVANFSDDSVGGVTGICVGTNGLEKYFRKFMTLIQLTETNIDSTLIAHATSLLGFRRSLLQPVRADSVADDTEEFLLIRKQGYRTVVDPSVISYEDVPNDFRKRRLQKDRRAQGIIKVLLENISMFLNSKYGRFGLVVLPLELFILILSPLFLVALGVVTSLLLYTIHPFFVLLLFALGIGLVRKSKIVSAIIDTELSGLIGTARSLLRRNDALWARVR